jgi:hypothetical protein
MLFRVSELLVNTAHFKNNSQKINELWPWKQARRPRILTVRTAYLWDGQATRVRLLEVTLTAQEPTLWKWDISEHGLEVMYGYETSRESAQGEGDTSCFQRANHDPLR